MRLLTFLFIVCVLLACLEKAIAGPGTSSKRKRDESSDEWADWSLNLATKNQLPASLAKVNIEKANKSGAQGLKLPGKKGKTTNAARTMRRARKRTSKPNMWPSYYWAKIPMKDPKTNQKKDMWHCFLLPHEWLACLWQDPRAQSACMPRPGSKLEHALHQLCPCLGLPVEGIIPFGLHGDAVPVLGTIRKTSLEFITVNLPAFHWKERVPFTVIQSKWIFGQDTKDEIWKIFMWSATCLKNGQYPDKRHDGSAWLKSDKQRRQMQGCLPAKGILCEIRADWDWFNQFLQLPTFNAKSGMCWMCNCAYENFKTQNAAQRACLKTKAEFLTNLANMKKTVSPIWEWPWNPAVFCCPDWLHSADQGVGADIAGMILVEIANKLPERNFRDRVSTLWNEIKDLYKTMRVEYTMSSFSPEILNKGKKPTGPPTLKAPAAQVRHMIPLLPVLAQRHFNPNVPHELACQRLAGFVATVYACMECNDTKNMPKACQKLALQYIELEKEALQIDPDNSKTWHIMPKLHLLQHLCEMGFPPKDTWAYKDETMGGTLAKLFTRRGGKDNPGHNCFEVLDRWCHTTAFPRACL